MDIDDSQHKLTLALIVDSLDIVELIGSTTKLTILNGLYNGRCPLHDEKGHLVIGFDKSLWFCNYCCSEGETIHNFVKEYCKSRELNLNVNLKIKKY